MNRYLYCQGHPHHLLIHHRSSRAINYYIILQLRRGPFVKLKLSRDIHWAINVATPSKKFNYDNGNQVCESRKCRLLINSPKDLYSPFRFIYSTRSLLQQPTSSSATHKVKCELYSQCNFRIIAIKDLWACRYALKFMPQLT